MPRKISYIVHAALSPDPDFSWYDEVSYKVEKEFETLGDARQCILDILVAFRNHEDTRHVASTYFAKCADYHDSAFIVWVSDKIEQRTITDTVIEIVSLPEGE